MKILLYGLNFAPELTGIGKYSGEMAAWLASHGHQVSVVTAAPYYPEWKVHRGFGGLRWRRESPAVPSPGHLTVLRCPLWVPGEVSGLKRLLHLFSFALTSVFPLTRALAARPDLVIVVAPALMVAPQAAVLACIFRVPSWLHIQDFEVDAALGMGIVNAGGLSSVVRRVESWLLRRFDRVSTISQAMLERLPRKGVAVRRTRMLRNWVDVHSICPLPRPNAYRLELGLTDRDVLILYAGNMGQKQGLEVVIDAARLLATRRGIRFLMVGAGNAHERLQRSAAGLSSITWWPLQPLERLNELLNAADIHVLPQRADAADLVMPSKLTGMLASAKPVVGTAMADTELGRILDSVGARVRPGDSAALAGVIDRWADDAPSRQDRGNAGRLYAEAHLGLDPVMNAFCDDARELVQEMCTTTNT